MKTGYEWLDTLPEVVKLQALENCKIKKNEHLLVKNFKTLKDCIYQLFSWRDTKQDYDYWKDIARGVIPTTTNLKHFHTLRWVKSKELHLSTTGKNYQAINMEEALKMFRAEFGIDPIYIMEMNPSDNINYSEKDEH